MIEKQKKKTERLQGAAPFGLRYLVLSGLPESQVHSTYRISLARRNIDTSCTLQSRSSSRPLLISASKDLEFFSGSLAKNMQPRLGHQAPVDIVFILCMCKYIYIYVHISYMLRVQLIIIGCVFCNIYIYNTLHRYSDKSCATISDFFTFQRSWPRDCLAVEGGKTQATKVGKISRDGIFLLPERMEMEDLVVSPSVPSLPAFRIGFTTSNALQM